MPEPRSGDELLEELVFDCLSADDVDAALQRVGARHPDLMARVRDVVDGLRRHEILNEEAAPASDAIPERLGEFRLIERLGSGGMGVVYLAEDERLGRRVAVKLVRPDHLYFPGSRERFRREVEAVARLQHPGIVAVHSVGEERGIPFFSMDYVVGRSVGDVLGRLRGRPAATLRAGDLFGDGVAKNGDLSETSASGSSWTQGVLSVVHDVACALHHAHERGVLHRDVKPSNILLDVSGHVRLFDFGLARLDDAQHLTAPQSELGSLPYMPPERLAGRGGEPGPRDDLYALGVTLFEMLTLRSPFLAGTAEQTRRRVLDGDCVAPRQLNPAIPRDVENVCLKAMDLRPERRYADIAEFIEELERLQSRRPVRARRAGAALRAWRWCQRHPATAVGLVLGTTLLTAAVGFGFYQRGVADRAQRLEREAREQSYFAGILGASANLLSGRTAAVRRSLAACPPELRHWEWGLLAACVNRSERTMPGHREAVVDLAFDATGEIFASASRDHTIRLWTRGASEAAAVLEGHGDWVTGVAFCADGRLLSASRDGTVRLWERNGDSTVVIESSAKFSSLAIDVQRGRIAVGDEDGDVRLYGVSGGLDGGSDDPLADLALLHHFAIGSADEGTRRRGMPRTPCFALVFDAGGRLFASAGRGIALWADPGAGGDPRRIGAGAGSGEPTIGHEAWVHALALHPDGESFVSADITGTLCRWRIRDGRPLQLPRAQGHGAIFCAAYAPNGEDLIVGGPVALGVIAPDLSSWRTRLLGHEGGVRALEVDPDGTRILTGGSDGELRSWLIDGPQVGPLQHGGAVRTLAIDPHGERLFTGTSGSGVRVWSLREGTPLARYGEDWRVVRDLELMPGERLMVAADSGLFRIDLATGETVTLEGRRALVAALATTPSGECCVAHADGTLSRWAPGVDEAVARNVARRDTIGRAASLACSPDGRWLVTGADDGGIHLWQGETLEYVRQIGEHAASSMAVAFHPLEPIVITAGFDQRIRFWHLPDGAPARPDLVWEDQLMTALALHPDGTRLAASSMLGITQLWHLESGEPLVELPREHRRGVLALSFTPDGDRLISGSWDRSVRIWDGSSRGR